MLVYPETDRAFEAVDLVFLHAIVCRQRPAPRRAVLDDGMRVGFVKPDARALERGRIRLPELVESSGLKART